MKELLSLIVSNIQNFEKSLNFRTGQKGFYDAIIEGLKKGWKTMYIEGPTGMGKTFIESAVAAAVIGDSHLRVLLLTSKITLLSQIQREFKKFTSYLKTGLFGGGSKDYRQQVTIMTYDSFRNLPEDVAKQFQVVLMDEGHKGLGPKTKAKLERQKKFSILIGFTASATYSAKKSLEEFLKNLAYKLSVVEAVQLGLLSNIKVMIASVDIEIENRRKGESQSDYEERISADIIREGGNIATARLWKRVFAKRNLRGIALVLTKKQGDDLVNEFAKEGIKSELIHSGLTTDERDDMFARFKNHEFDVLVGMGIIIEGFDDVGVSVAITTYPIQSLVVMTQFPGRAERTDDENPDKVAYIVNMAYKTKKQLFYTDILDGISQVLQKKKRKKKLDIISSSEMQKAIAKKPDSFITAVAVDEEEVMSVIRDNRGFYNSKLDKIPDNWSTPKALSTLPVFKNNDQGIIIIAERYRSSNPEYFANYYSRGRVVECYSPELILILIDTFKARKKAPKGWMTANKLSALWKKDSSTIKLKAEEFRTKNSEHFNLYWTLNRFAEHYSPKLISWIETDLFSFTKDLSGWESFTAIYARLGGRSNNIKKFLHSFEEEHPEWFYIHLNRFTYYDRPLILLAEKKFPPKKKLAKDALKQDPNLIGWMTANKLKQEFKITCSRNYLITFVEEYKKDFPHYFKVKGRFTYLSPDFISLIVDRFKKPLKGWNSANKLSQSVGITSNPNTIRKFVEQYRQVNKAWFKQHYIRNKFVDFYAPELISLIKKNCRN